MGIDIYARWRGQTVAEREAQTIGFTATAGHIGYLRESYHGEPYATVQLCREAFASEAASAIIPAATLRKRLPVTLMTAEDIARDLYLEDDIVVEKILRSFRDFVDLCERKERETGQPVEIVAGF